MLLSFTYDFLSMQHGPLPFFLAWYVYFPYSLPLALSFKVIISKVCKRIFPMANVNVMSKRFSSNYNQIRGCQTGGSVKIEQAKMDWVMKCPIS